MRGFAGYFSDVGGVFRDILRHILNVGSHFRDHRSAVADCDPPISRYDCQYFGDAG